MLHKSKHNGIQCQIVSAFGEVNKGTSVMSRTILPIDAMELGVLGRRDLERCILVMYNL